MPCSSDETFEAEVIDRSKQGQPVLVDFTADWCGPCKLVEPLLADLDGQGAVKVVKAKPEHTSTFRTWLVEQGSKYGISGLPTSASSVRGYTQALLHSALISYAHVAVRSAPLVAQLSSSKKVPLRRCTWEASMPKSSRPSWATPRSRWSLLSPTLCQSLSGLIGRMPCRTCRGYERWSA